MAKKANSAYDGTLIQIKRTDLSLDDETGKEKIDNDGPLKYGEPLYVNKDKLLIIGDNYNADGSKTATSDLNVFKAIPRNLAPVQTFYAYADESTTSSGRVQLINESSEEIYPQFRTFTEVKYNTDKEKYESVDIDNNNNIAKITIDNWYAVNETTGEIDESNKITDPITSTVFPRAQIIYISKMVDEIIPYISLCVTPEQRGKKTTTESQNQVKNLQKSFSRITDVESQSGKIIVYVSNNPIITDCYINVFGG